jgi:predicted nucleic acid-binding protein
VFFESGVEEFAVPESVLDEVRAYIPAFSTKTGLPQDVLDFLLELLPLTLYAASTYRRTIPEAVRLIGRRDPDDVAPLALALHLDLPIWTNDRDFEQTGVSLYTTAQLLAVLFPKRDK